MIPWSTFHSHRAVATSVRCIEISRRAALGIIVHVRSFKRNSRARGRSCVTVQGHASRGAYSRRDVVASRHVASIQSARRLGRTHNRYETLYLGQVGVVTYLGVHRHLASVNLRDGERRGEQECQHRPSSLLPRDRHTRQFHQKSLADQRSPRGRSFG